MNDALGKTILMGMMDRGFTVSWLTHMAPKPEEVNYLKASGDTDKQNY
jgi:hypothetical protein